MGSHFHARRDSNGVPVDEDVSSDVSTMIDGDQWQCEAMGPAGDRHSDCEPRGSRAPEIEDADWDVFLADDDELDPLPDRDDFWIDPISDSLDD